MKTQTERIADVLRSKGWVSREECLGMFPRIERLAARINDLRKLGWNIKGKRSDGDYVYTLISAPPHREVRYSRGAGAYGYRLWELEETQQKLPI